MAGLEGTTLGPYQVKGLLGSGGMGQVYRAHDPRLDREVAIKVLALGLAQEPGYLERFRREARAVAQLNHPNIVQVYDFGEQGNLVYLVMPLIPGGTLRDSLAKRGALPLAEALSICEQIASALQYAHERGLIHRDVKPANVLLSAEGRALLTDFGIVRLARKEDTMETLTRVGAFVGSPEYAAPEMIMGQPIDHRVDIYALGISLYQMLTGKLPFTAATPVSLLVMHTSQTPPPPRTINPAIPPAVEAVVLKAIAKAPNERYQSVAELVASLRAASAAQPVAGAPAPATPGTQARPQPVPQVQPATNAFSNLPTVAGPPPGSGPASAAPGWPVTVAPPGWASPASGPAGGAAQGSGPSAWASGPSGWAGSASGPSSTPPPPPTFVTGLAALPGQPPAVPAPRKTPPRRRLLPVMLLALALILVAGGGVVLALGISQNFFKKSSPPTAQQQQSPTVRATSTPLPSPTATMVPTTYYMAHIFLVKNQDLQNGDRAGNQIGINNDQYLSREGPQGDLYQMGDALQFARAAGDAQVIFDSSGAAKFVFLVDRLATYLDAQGYFQHLAGLIPGQKTPMMVGEQAIGGKVPTADGKQTYQLFVRDRNVILILTSVPAGTLQQDFSAYFLSVAQTVAQRGEACNYDPQSLKLVSGDPNGCK